MRRPPSLVFGLLCLAVSVFCGAASAGDIPPAPWSHAGRLGLVNYPGKIQPIRCHQEARNTHGGEALEEQAPKESPKPVFLNQSPVCVDATPAAPATTVTATTVTSSPAEQPSRICTKLCNVECLEALARGEVWLRCLVSTCPGVVKEEYASLVNDSISVAVGAVMVPLQPSSTATTTTTTLNATLSPDAVPRHRDIQASANSSFLANLQEIIKTIRSQLPFNALSTRVAVVQKFGTELCRRLTHARVVFTVHSARAVKSMTISAGETGLISIPISPEDGPVLFNTKVEELSQLEADQCISPIWVEPRLLTTGGEDDGAMTSSQTPCKPHCTAELLRSGRAPLSCFVAGCSGERFRLSSSSSRRQPFLIFPCLHRPIVLGVDTAVVRRAKAIHFHHDRPAQSNNNMRALTSGLGMKGNVELLFDLAMIRRNLSAVSPETVFDLLSAQVGLVPVTKQGCHWSKDGELKFPGGHHASHSEERASVKFSVFVDGEFCGATSVTGLRTKEMVVNLMPSAKLLMLRVMYTDSTSKRCTRPVWSELELQPTRPLHFIPCQRACRLQARDGIYPLSCFTGICSGHMAHQSFRPYFWIQKSTSGVGIDTIKATAKSRGFRVGAQLKIMPFGLGAHPPSTLVFDLNAFRRANLTFNMFSSHMGIDVGTRCSHMFGQAFFRVYLDERLVRGRRLLHAHDRSAEFHIPVDGARWLKLLTKYPTGGDSASVCAHAVWGGARLWTLVS